MSITTKRGDDGFSDIGGNRVPKSDPRIRLCGSLDYLNSTLGMLIAVLPSGIGDIKDFLDRIQRDLFEIGRICCIHGIESRHTRKTIMDILQLEEKTESLESLMPPLHQFIQPGGHISACWAHLARTACRFTESDLSAWAFNYCRDQKSTKNILVYINRLSDFLYVLARYCNLLTGTKENLLEE
jgi:cob(I)alamin adenosyltransferase